MIIRVLFAADTASTQRVYAIVVALVVLGVLFAVLAVWLVRQTRVDPELLAPLEKMDEREWRERDPAEQHRQLDEVRPVGATPLRRARSVPDVDAELPPSGPPQKSLDDLAPAKLSSQRLAPTAEALTRRVSPSPPVASGGAALPPPTGIPAQSVAPPDPLLGDPEQQPSH